MHFALWISADRFVLVHLHWEEDRQSYNKPFLELFVRAPFLARQNKLLLKAILQIAAMQPRKQIKLQFARRKVFRLSPNDDAGDM